MTDTSKLIIRIAEITAVIASATITCLSVFSLGCDMSPPSDYCKIVQHIFG